MFPAWSFSPVLKDRSGVRVPGPGGEPKTASAYAVPANTARIVASRST
jgi:hypothetical protein